jgi:hypothetical protein
MKERDYRPGFFLRLVQRGFSGIDEAVTEVDSIISEGKTLQYALLPDQVPLL